MADLAEDVTARERDTARSEVDVAAVKDTRLLLYHKHVPKLADAGLVAYHRERDTVELLEYPTDLDSRGEPQAPAADH